MGAGARNIVVSLVRPARAAEKNSRFGDAPGKPVAAQTWRDRLFCQMTVRTGGEQTLDVETQSNAIADFTFDYMDVMEPDQAGAVISESMAIQMEDDPSSLWDIDLIVPDTASRRSVRVIAVRKRQLA
jgi:hypothetical protein